MHLHSRMSCQVNINFMFYGENEAKNQGKKLQNQSGSVLGELKQKIQYKGIFH